MKVDNGYAIGNRDWRRGRPGHCYTRRHPGAYLRAARTAPEDIQRLSIHRARRPYPADAEDERPTRADDGRHVGPAYHAEPGHDGSPPAPHESRLGSALQR